MFILHYKDDKNKKFTQTWGISRYILTPLQMDNQGDSRTTLNH